MMDVNNKGLNCPSIVMNGSVPYVFGENISNVSVFSTKTISARAGNVSYRNIGPPEVGTPGRLRFLPKVIMSWHLPFA